MKVEVFPDRARTVWTFEGDFDNEQAFDEVPARWEEIWESRDAFGGIWDSIVDLSRLTGALTWEVVPPIAEKWNAFVGDRQNGARVVLVSGNPSFPPLARAVASQFPAREFHVAASVAEAHALLDMAQQPDPV